MNNFYIENIMKQQIGWFIFGAGKFGLYLLGGEGNPAPVDEIRDITYWKNLGYELIPAYINNKDNE